MGNDRGLELSAFMIFNIYETLASLTLYWTRTCVCQQNDVEMIGKFAA